MRVITLILILFISGISYGQELNIGIEFTGGPRLNEANVIALGPIIEYRLRESVVSINSGIIFHVYKNESLITLPIGLKFILGNTVRFCPIIGGFLRSNSNYGFSAGVVIDYEIKKRLYLFIKGEYDQDYWNEESLSYFGGVYESKHIGSSYWFGIGIKKNIL